MEKKQDRIEQQPSEALTIIPKQIFEALLTLHEKLDNKNIEWAVGGDLSETLRVVQVEPTTVEIVTNKENLEKAFFALQDYNPTDIESKVQKLDRNAVVSGVEHPAYMRSHCFETSIQGVPVKILSDIQYKINDWDWGDILQFVPEYTYIVNKKTALVPISIKYDLYQGLGWTDRMEKIKRVFEMQERQRLLNPR